MVSHEPEPVDELGDFGFYDADSLMVWAPDYYLSGHHPGHLPKTGGKLAQTKAVQHDLALYLKGIAWAQWEKRQDEENQARAQEMMGNDYG